MNKTEITGVVLIIAVVFGGLAIDNYTKQKTAIEAVKAGLEECPIKTGFSPQTIWVKDCPEYIKTIEAQKANNTKNNKENK